MPDPHLCSPHTPPGRPAEPTAVTPRQVPESPGAHQICRGPPQTCRQDTQLPPVSLSPFTSDERIHPSNLGLRGLGGPSSTSHPGTRAHSSPPAPARHLHPLSPAGQGGGECPVLPVPSATLVVCGPLAPPHAPVTPLPAGRLAGSPGATAPGRLGGRASREVGRRAHVRSGGCPSRPAARSPPASLPKGQPLPGSALASPPPAVPRCTAPQSGFQERGRWLQRRQGPHVQR